MSDNYNREVVPSGGTAQGANAQTRSSQLIDAQRRTAERITAEFQSQAAPSQNAQFQYAPGTSTSGFNAYYQPLPFPGSHGSQSSSHTQYQHSRVPSNQASPPFGRNTQYQHSRVPSNQGSPPFGRNTQYQSPRAPSSHLRSTSGTGAQSGSPSGRNTQYQPPRVPSAQESDPSGIYNEWERAQIRDAQFHNVRWRYALPSSPQYQTNQGTHNPYHTYQGPNNQYYTTPGRYDYGPPPPPPNPQWASAQGIAGPWPNPQQSNAYGRATQGYDTQPPNPQHANTYWTRAQGQNAQHKTTQGTTQQANTPWGNAAGANNQYRTASGANAQAQNNPQTNTPWINTNTPGQNTPQTFAQGPNPPRRGAHDTNPYDYVSAAHNMFDWKTTSPDGILSPVLVVANRQLEAYTTSNHSRAIMDMPGTDVAIVHQRITPTQIMSRRLSYINGILIQSRGVMPLQQCDQCVGRLRPFPECRRIPGKFGGACGNCKWRDLGKRCSFTTQEPVDMDSRITELSNGEVEEVEDDRQVVPYGPAPPDPAQH